ncbi:hypothetical protein GKE82_02065 [Conexibacter sp. W3-3-2]|uniref:Uncharacterized protein n=1 Tax=Paraconexibacter algicola TaxID=2133960 RepID=A0A2T4UCD4_9ACTN|nr:MULTISPECIES: hypothetical protein [Solirubrobacterales]MTD43121.1 hypothetical protein [Conexibacter sp. W3-3-2]PTL54874.1 hypothetical protein C7Y72_20050 [Paraconexibacter algicola]
MAALVTSLAGLLCLALAAYQEVRTARTAGVSVATLERPPALRYLLIAFPFLFVVSALGEEHLLLGVGLAVLAQSAYVTWWRGQRRA